MVTINLVDPRRSVLVGSKGENEICDIFYQHWEKMKLEVNNMVGDINAWRSARLREINLYADEQIRLLAKNYRIQRAHFDTCRRENLEISKALSQLKMDDAFKELSEACNMLKFQVAQLDYVQYYSRYPTILTVEDLQRGRIQKLNTVQMDGIYGYRDRSTIDNAKVIGENDVDNLRSYSQSPLSSDGMSGCFKIPSLRDPALQRVNSELSESNSSKNKNDELHSECPICFMLFPLHMTIDDQYQHVDEHD